VVEHIDWFRCVVPEGVTPVNQDGEVTGMRIEERERMESVITLLHSAGQRERLTGTQQVADFITRQAGPLADAVLARPIGHLLGGPTEDDRTALAIACATRHIGVAVMVATSLPGPRTIVILAVYITTSLVISLPYLRWRRAVAPRGGLARRRGARGRGTRHRQGRCSWPGHRSGS